MSEKTLILVRHGDPLDKWVGRFLGSTDIPLSERGQWSAQRLTARLAPLVPFACVSSPLQRAQQTAEIATTACCVEIEVDSNLCEMDFGTWEGLNFQEILTKDPELVKDWTSGSLDFAFPNGEAIKTFVERTKRACEALTERTADTVVAFAHGGVIRFVLCHLLGLDAKHPFIFDVGYASITRLSLNDGYAVLRGLNDQCHLENR